MKRQLQKLLKQREKLKNLVEVTFYIPCYNEEFSIIPTLNKLTDIVDNLGITYELLIYNDGSTDQTKALVEKYAKVHPTLTITIVNNHKPKGLGYNYIDGAFRGLGTYYMMICGDNSETEESITAVLGKKGIADIVVPYFGTLDSRSFFRRYLSRLFTRLVNVINGYQLNYYNGIVLHLRHNVMRYHPTSSGFAYQAELLTILLDEHRSFVQVNISNIDRKAGISKAFTLQNIFSVSHSLLQIFFRRIRRSIWPL